MHQTDPLFSFATSLNHVNQLSNEAYLMQHLIGYEFVLQAPKLCLEKLDLPIKTFRSHVQV